MNTLIYSRNQQAREAIAATRLREQTLVSDNLLLLENLKDSSLKLFIAQVENIHELPLKVLSQILRILPTSGQIVVRFANISKEEFEQFLKLLKAVGFKNNIPTQGALSNEVVFIKPAFQQAAQLKRPVQEKVTSATDSKPVEQNNNIYGQYMPSPVVQVEPEIKKKNAFEVAASSQGATVDEAALLNNDKVEAPVKEESCSTKPKACKNCTCGRKEKEETVSESELLKQLEKGDIKSSCGNCYLGDAFRCASCPYKGLPAFKPGDKIKLDQQVNDTTGGQSQDGEVKVTGGKVKIDL